MTTDLTLGYLTILYSTNGMEYGIYNNNQLVELDMILFLLVKALHIYWPMYREIGSGHDMKRVKVSEVVLGNVLCVLFVIAFISVFLSSM